MSTTRRTLAGATCSSLMLASSWSCSLRNLVAQVALGAQQARGCLRRDLQRVDEPRPAEHPGLDRVREHGVDAAEVLAFGRDLPRDPGQVLKVTGVGALGFLVPAGADEVGDLYFVCLAVPVHAADSLFEPVGVERDVVVDDPVAVPLQVDALARGVGREQDAHRVAVQAAWKAALRCSRLFSSMPPNSRPSRSPPRPRAVRMPGEPLLGGLVFGEDDDALALVPVAVRAADAVELGDERLGLGVGGLGVALRPFGELAAVGGLHDGAAGFPHVVEDAGQAGDAAEDLALVVAAGIVVGRLGVPAEDVVHPVRSSAVIGAATTRSG